jgi:hypothetical protein
MLPIQYGEYSLICEGCEGSSTKVIIGNIYHIVCMVWYHLHCVLIKIGPQL